MMTMELKHITRILVHILQMIWTKKWKFNYRWMTKVMFAKVYVVPMRKGHVDT